MLAWVGDLRNGSIWRGLILCFADYHGPGRSGASFERRSNKSAYVPQQQPQQQLSSVLPSYNAPRSSPSIKSRTPTTPLGTYYAHDPNANGGIHVGQTANLPQPSLSQQFSNLVLSHPKTQSSYSIAPNPGNLVQRNNTISSTPSTLLTPPVRRSHSFTTTELMQQAYNQQQQQGNLFCRRCR